jgi:hypothetical protein
VAPLHQLVDDREGIGIFEVAHDAYQQQRDGLGEV